jgi:hypothetical protein
MMWHSYQMMSLKLTSHFEWLWQTPEPCWSTSDSCGWFNMLIPTLFAAILYWRLHVSFTFLPHSWGSVTHHSLTREQVSDVLFQCWSNFLEKSMQSPANL